MHTAVQEALEKAKQRADQAEVYRVQRRETPVSFEANRLKMLETKESSGMALRHRARRAHRLLRDQRRR